MALDLGDITGTMVGLIVRLLKSAPSDPLVRFVIGLCEKYPDLCKSLVGLESGGRELLSSVQPTRSRRRGVEGDSH
jgi:hypothetical protein